MSGDISSQRKITTFPGLNQRIQRRVDYFLRLTCPSPDSPVFSYDDVFVAAMKLYDSKMQIKFFSGFCDWYALNERQDRGVSDPQAYYQFHDMLVSRVSTPGQRTLYQQWKQVLHDQAQRDQVQWCQKCPVVTDSTVPPPTCLTTRRDLDRE